MANYDLSIIILSYKSREHLKVLLPSVWESEGVGFEGEGSNNENNNENCAEVIVVDNGSNDGTVEWLEAEIRKLGNWEINKQNQDLSPVTFLPVTNRLKLIKNTNTGFAHGNNLGIKQASGKYILLLNPDTKLEKNTLKEMLDFMEANPNVGISGCKLIKEDGKLDLACRRRFPNPVNSFKRLILQDNRDYNYSDISEDESMEVDSVVGAFMMIRRIEKNGESEKLESKDFCLSNGNYLDEDFFMYGEDLDLCWRCKQAGFKVWYYPKVICHHYKGESSKKIPFKALRWFHDAMWIFYKKHYAKQYFILFNGLVWLAIYLRFCLLIIINSFKKTPKVS